MRRTLFALYFSMLLASTSTCVNAAKIFSTKDHEGRAYIYIIGKIEAGDEVNFKELLIRLLKSGDYIHMVAIYSPGGNVGAAIDIGLNIRKLHLMTYTVIREICAVIDGRKIRMVDRQNCLCASACFLIWAAGLSKGGDHIRVHRISYDPAQFGALSYEHAQRQYGAGQATVEAYLKDMDVPDWIIRKMMSVPSNATSRLTNEELRTLDINRVEEELKIARCGPNWRDEKVFRCNEKIDREIFFEAARKFLAENG